MVLTCSSSCGNAYLRLFYGGLA